MVTFPAVIGPEVVRVVARLSSRGLWRETCSGGDDRVRTGFPNGTLCNPEAPTNPPCERGDPKKYCNGRVDGCATGGCARDTLRAMAQIV